MPRLVLIRHGQSSWNLENRFTGWWDVDLTAKGEKEAWEAGELMRERGLDFDLCFTSFQTRAIKTLHIALEAMGRLWLPEEKDWRLNERHYGGLTGLDKDEMRARHGEEQVHIWRRSFDISAHGNSLRALVKHLSNIPDAEITGLEIPTGQPIVYELDEGLNEIERYYLKDR